jgi:hypothetical protein
MKRVARKSDSVHSLLAVSLDNSQFEFDGLGSAAGLGVEANHALVIGIKLQAVIRYRWVREITDRLGQHLNRHKSLYPRRQRAHMACSLAAIWFFSHENLPREREKLRRRLFMHPRKCG